MYTRFLHNKLHRCPSCKSIQNCFLSLPNFCLQVKLTFDDLYIYRHFLAISDRLIGLPEGRARNHNRPQQVPVLSGVFIEDIAVGAEHTLALSSTGDVYAWGSNSEGQVCPCLFLTMLLLYRCGWNMYLVESQALIFVLFLLLSYNNISGFLHNFHFPCTCMAAGGESTDIILSECLLVEMVFERNFTDS